MGGRGSSSGKAVGGEQSASQLTGRALIEAQREEIRQRWANGIPQEITDQIEAERAEIDAVMDSPIPERGWQALDIDQQSFERETLKQAKSDLKDAIKDDALSDDNVWDIVYSDGTYVRANDVVASGKKVKMTGIKSIINSNESTTMFAGKVKFYSMLEEESKEYLNRIRRNGSSPFHEPSAGYGSDWRVDFA